MVSSRRRRARKLPWVLGGLIVVSLLAYTFWPGDTTEAGTAEPDSRAQTTAGENRSPSDSNSRTNTAGITNHTRSTEPSPANRLPGQITLGETRGSFAPRELTAAGSNHATPPDPTPNTAAAATASSSTQSASAPPRQTAAATPRAQTRVADERVREGMRLIAEGKLVAGRAVLSELLFDRPSGLGAADADTIRSTLASVNEQLIFSGDAIAHDPLTEYYTVRPGDTLGEIAPHYKIPYQFVELINDVDARRLRADQKIKLVKGPFHARVSKRDYRMDLYLNGSNGLPIYVMSVPVGLGEGDSTPVGKWRIKQGSKVVNPDWRNPRTGEYFAADDPKNPIGEYWLALEGIDETTEGIKGYGIHGTIDADSIGDQRSMGCIRLRDQDIQLMFKMLTGGQSTVEIVP
jgi:LysM repeat protein